MVIQIPVSTQPQLPPPLCWATPMLQVRKLGIQRGKDVPEAGASGREREAQTAVLLPSCAQVWPKSSPLLPQLLVPGAIDPQDPTVYIYFPSGCPCRSTPQPQEISADVAVAGSVDGGSAGRGLPAPEQVAVTLAVGRGNPEFSPHLPPRLVHLAVKRNSFLGGPRGKGCLSPWACVCSHRGSQKADKPRFGALLCHCQPCSFRQVMALFCAPVSLFAR